MGKVNCQLPAPEVDERRELCCVCDCFCFFCSCSCTYFWFQFQFYLYAFLLRCRCFIFIFCCFPSACFCCRFCFGFCFYCFFSLFCWSFFSAFLIFCVFCLPLFTLLLLLWLGLNFAWRRHDAHNGNGGIWERRRETGNGTICRQYARLMEESMSPDLFVRLVRVRGQHSTPFAFCWATTTNKYVDVDDDNTITKTLMAVSSGVNLSKYSRTSFLFGG